MPKADMRDTLAFLEGEPGESKKGGETLKTKEVEKKPKRGHYKKQECPYCHKHFGNLENHIKMVHKTEAEAAGKDLTAKGKQELTNEDLTGERPREQIETEIHTNITYYCTNCILLFTI